MRSPTQAKGREGTPSRTFNPVSCSTMHTAEPAAPPPGTPSRRRRAARKGTSAESFPAMTRHSSGQARVRLNGKAHYLSRWGSIEAHAAYAELLQRWKQQGRQSLTPRVPHAGELAFTVADLFARFEAWLDATGKYTKGGAPTSSRDFFQQITRSFSAFAGTVQIRRLSEALLMQWRDVLEGDAKLTRKGINRKVTGLLAIAKWGRARGFVPRDVALDCAAIVPLKQGECGSRPERGRERRAPTFDEIEKVAAAAPRQVAAMIRLQALTGMRPGEACALRWCDVDKKGPTVDQVPTWIYTVEGAKTAHHGHVTRYALPPAAQSILQDFPALPRAFVFSPAGRMADKRREQREARSTRVQPSQQRRDEAARHPYAERWSVDGYRNAVEAACARAGVDRFTPHEIRHSFATWAAGTLGVMVAAVALNHRSPATTQRYLHGDPAAAFVAAAAVQKRVSG